MDKGAVGTGERVYGQPRMIGDVLDEVAKGDMVDDACGGGGLVEVGMRVVVRGNVFFVRAEEPHEVG